MQGKGFRDSDSVIQIINNKIISLYCFADNMHVRRVGPYYFPGLWHYKFGCNGDSQPKNGVVSRGPSAVEGGVCSKAHFCRQGSVLPFLNTKRVRLGGLWNQEFVCLGSRASYLALAQVPEIFSL